MKKKSFVNLIIGVMGGLLFALGMCMCLITEWDASTPGLFCAGIGLFALLLLARNVIPKKTVNWKTIGKVLYGILATMVLGVGMCLVLAWHQIMWGVIVSLLGVLLLLLLIPMCFGLK